MREYMHSLPTMPALPPALERIIKFSDLAMQQAKANGRKLRGQRSMLFIDDAKQSAVITQW